MNIIIVWQICQCPIVIESSTVFLFSDVKLDSKAIQKYGYTVFRSWLYSTIVQRLFKTSNGRLGQQLFFKHLAKANSNCNPMRQLSFMPAKITINQTLRTGNK